MNVGNLLEIFYVNSVDDIGIWEKIIFWKDCHDKMFEILISDKTWMSEYIEVSLHFSYMSPSFLLDDSVKYFPVSR